MSGDGSMPVGERIDRMGDKLAKTSDALASHEKKCAARNAVNDLKMAQIEGRLETIKWTVIAIAVAAFDDRTGLLTAILKAIFGG